MNFFQKLGSLVARLWKQENYDERTFPAIAMHGLAELPPAKNVSFRDALLLGLTDPLSTQADLTAEFGQPPLTVYIDEAFRIELLFWLKALPSIHQHGFSGAFHVMHGSTLHTSWQFQQRERVTTGLLLGDLRLKQVELLQQGDSRLIIAGSRFVHTTYHLQQPTVSVVVRTIKERDSWPQYVYLPPSVAFDPEELRPSVVRRRQLLTMLLELGRTAECFDLMKHLLASSDDSGAFHYLLWANTSVQDSNMLREILLAAKVNHAHLVEEVEPVLKYLRRQARLEKIKDAVVDPDLQFLLGVLLNVPDRDMAMSMLREQYPSSDPIVTATQLTDRLSRLGVIGFRFNDTWRFMLSCLLQGVTQLDEIKRLFASRYGTKAVLDAQKELEELARMMGQFWIFEPYFRSILRQELVTQPELTSTEAHA